MNISRKVVITLVSCILSLLSAESLSAQPKKLPLLDRMVASVNDEAVTESELNREMELLLVSLKQTDTALPSLSEVRQQLLEKLIMEKCQLQLAKEQGLAPPSETEITQTIEELAKRDHLTLTQLKDFLKDQHISYEQFRQHKKKEMILSSVQMRTIGQMITIPDKELDTFLRSPMAQDQSDTEYHLAHILIPIPEAASVPETQQAKRKAEQVVKEIKAGANFNKIAMTQSAGQQALTGGDLGWRKMIEIPTSFVQIVSTLQSGESYGPIQDSSGFHIIKLLEKRSPNNNKNLVASNRQRAFEMLYQRKFEEALVPWLRNLRANAEVEIYLNET